MPCSVLPERSEKPESDPGNRSGNRWFARLLAGFAATTVVVGMTAVSATASAESESPRAKRIQAAANVAVRQIGDRYAYGSAGPRSFDCSGLIFYSFHRAGLRGLPRTSSAQARFARRIPRRSLRRGDLMFFHNSYGVYHVGIFLKRKNGHVVMLHSPYPGKRVQRAVPWTSSWYAGTLRRRR
ncbi:MAG: C40 family peptidase [Nocardioides sp.]